MVRDICGPVKEIFRYEERKGEGGKNRGRRKRRRISKSRIFEEDVWKADYSDRSLPLSEEKRGECRRKRKVIVTRCCATRECTLGLEFRK